MNKILLRNRLLSYIFPVRIKEFNSDLNGKLEINLVNGRKILDTQTSNYSYGSLQQILKTGLRKIGFNTSYNRVLVLGMGGGSVVQTIREDFFSGAFIELVEIDPQIVAIATNEFGILRYGNISIINGDAIVYIRNSKDFFNLIIVDLFIGDEVPVKFTEPEFIHDLSLRLEPGGKIIFNTMRETMNKTDFNRIKQCFLEMKLRINVLQGVGGLNDLIIAEN